MNGCLRVHALAKEFVLLDEADLFRHAAQKQSQLFQWRERFGDVVVSAEFHGLDGGFDRAMPGHQRDLAARQQLLHLFQELESRHVRHDHVGENHVGGLLFEQRERRIAAIGFEAHKAESLPNGDA